MEQMTNATGARELTRVQELVYELRIEQVMTKEVIAVSTDTTIAELKEVLRVNRISGCPVLQGDELVETGLPLLGIEGGVDVGRRKAAGFR